MGSVYKRDKIWWIKYNHNGEVIRETSKSTSKSTAKNLLKVREGQNAEGRLPRNHIERVTFNDLAEDLLTDYRINNKKSTPRAEQAVRLHLNPFFGGMKVPEITTSRINEYIRSRQGTVAMNATINRELAYLKRMLNLGAEHTPPKIEQVPRIFMLAENNTREGFFEADQFLRLRDALPEHLQGIVTFAYKTGWRRGEIVNLTWDRVDRKNSIVRLEPRETKNGEGRTVYLDPELAQVIQRLFLNQQIGCPYVFQRSGRKDRQLYKGLAERLQESRCRRKTVPRPEANCYSQYGKGRSLRECGHENKRT